MTQLEVKIERLEPMRIAAFRAFGENPEMGALEKMQSWLKAEGMTESPGSRTIFGFNNPAPGPGSKEYGYEFWLQISPQMKTKSAGEVQDFAGGLYAVATIQGFPSPQVWKSLWDWVSSSKYTWRKTHELERPHNLMAPEQEMVFSLYLPIEG